MRQTTGTDAISGQQVANVFMGISIDVAVRDSDAYLHRVGYSATLLGRIRFIQ